MQWYIHADVSRDPVRCWLHTARFGGKLHSSCAYKALSICWDLGLADLRWLFARHITGCRYRVGLLSWCFCGILNISSIPFINLLNEQICLTLCYTETYCASLLAFFFLREGYLGIYKQPSKDELYLCRHLSFLHSKSFLCLCLELFSLPLSHNCKPLTSGRIQCPKWNGGTESVSWHAQAPDHLPLYSRYFLQGSIQEGN